jgi:hypothetical protein
MRRLGADEGTASGHRAEQALRTPPGTRALADDDRALPGVAA